MHNRRVRSVIDQKKKGIIKAAGEESMIPAGTKAGKYAKRREKDD